MFRQIRKRKNALNDEATKELLRSCRRGVLAVYGMDGYPYAIPLNYLYDEENNKIYFHSSPAGHKAEALSESDKVCFTVYGNETIKEEEWAPFTQSTVVFGRCHKIESREETIDKVRKFALKYYPNAELVEEEIKMSGAAVRMYEIEIDHMSGKEVQER